MDIDAVPNTIDVSNDVSDDQNDPVVSEVPVYLNHLQDPPFMCGEIYVLLNTLRHQSRPYGDQGQLCSVEFEEESNRLRLNYTLNTRADTYDASATHAVHQHSLVAKSAPRDATTGSYCVGVLSDGILNLVPVSALCQVKPSFEHIDTEAASRKTAGVAKSDEASKPLTGKALHYQQLVRCIRPERSHWRQLDHYDFDSVEAADLVQEHILVHRSKKLREIKMRPLDFRGDQEQYLFNLSSQAEADKGAEGLHELSRLDFSRQVETVMKRMQIVKLSELLSSLPANTRARYSETDVLAQLDQCALCIKGVWVVLSHLSPHRPQMWDTRDALLVLLQAGRDVTVQLLSGIGALPKDDIEDILRHVCSLDLLSNTWKLKLKEDVEFVAARPEVLKRHELVVNAMIHRLRVKKERAQSGAPTAHAPSTFSADEMHAMTDLARARLADAGALTTDELRQTLQAQTRDHFVSEAATLEVLRHLQAVPLRERWALQTKGAEVDPLRHALIAMYRERDALTKPEILASFNAALGRQCELTDHDLRRLIKEFAHNAKGYWVFNGEAIAERRVKCVKDELDHIM